MTINEHNRYSIYTPTVWQTVILRNYGLVSNKVLASVLKCRTSTIEKEAKRLGINSIPYNPIWREKSYLTIIRANWSILPIFQILTLLNMSKEEFEFELKENDFLFVKLGKKPECNEVIYYPLSTEDKNATSKIRHIINKHFIDDFVEPFSFKYNSYSVAKDNNNLRIVYPYSAPYGDILLTSSDLVSDEELFALSKVGINGIWFQGLLSKLSAYPFSKNNDIKYQIRRKNLNIFIQKAKKYDIGVYLYFNEPRSIKIDDLDARYIHLSGRKENDQVSLCISQKEVQEYLYNATKDFLNNVPELAGIMTITSSENLTHCKHILGSNCEKCKNYKPYELAALINNIIYKAIDDTKSNAKLIANLWGWAPYCGYSKEDISKGIKLLNKNIILMCVSEFGTHKKGKTTYTIDEYSISHGEPCLETYSTLKIANKLGFKTMAKIQINTTWEMASLPYIPVFENVINHIDKLKKLNVANLFESWTLGGYPGITMNLVNSYDDNFNYDLWLKNIYKSNSEKVKRAVHYFSKGFSIFPFQQNTLYFSPIALGPINPLFIEKSNLEATMVTFPYDDVNKWIEKETRDESLLKYEKLISLWKKGLTSLKEIENEPNTLELLAIAKAFYDNIVSFINQYKYYSKIIDYTSFKKVELKSLLDLYEIASKNPTIGFEASNHYLYSQNMFLEKLISLKTR